MTVPANQSVAVKRIVALVELEHPVNIDTLARAPRQPGVDEKTWDKLVEASVPRVLIARGSPPILAVLVRLSAETCDGRCIPSGHHDFGISGPRHGVGSTWFGNYRRPRPDDPRQPNAYKHRHHVGLGDIEDGIDSMLGRRSYSAREPAWTQLIRALAEHGVQVTEEDLINVPLTVELHPEVRAEIENHQSPAPSTQPPADRP